ncbi:hypothetical protein GVAV_000802 [Gurleya vavrai]
MENNEISSFLSSEQETLSLLLPDNTDVKPEQSDSIYLSNIYDLISNLHQKITSLQNKTTIQDSVSYHYCNLYKYLVNNRHKEAKNYLKALCNDVIEPDNNELNKIFLNVVNHVNFLIKMFNEIRGMVNMKIGEFKDYEIKVSDFINKSKQFDNFLVDLDKILEKEESFLKENSDSSIKLENKDLNIEFNKLFINEDNNKKVENSQEKCKLILKKIDFLVDKIEDLKLENKKLKSKNNNNSENNVKNLQEENIKLQESLNELTERNVKMKKENVLLSNELKLQKEANRRRQSAIEKQKKIIEVLQSKFGKENDNNFFIDELKNKIDNLRIEIGCENSIEKRNKKITEMVDCEKRLNDYLKFVKKE